MSLHCWWKNCCFFLMERTVALNTSAWFQKMQRSNFVLWMKKWILTELSFKMFGEESSDSIDDSNFCRGSIFWQIVEALMSRGNGWCSGADGQLYHHRRAGARVPFLKHRGSLVAQNKIHNMQLLWMKIWLSKARHKLVSQGTKSDVEEHIYFQPNTVWNNLLQSRAIR